MCPAPSSKAQHNIALPPPVYSFPKRLLHKALYILCKLGHSTLAGLAALGRFVLFFWTLLRYGLTPPYDWKETLHYFIEMAYVSLPVIALTALFTGMVLALQSYTGFSRLHAADAIAHVVALSVTRELAPVLVGLMIVGRLGAAMASELSTMRVTEQLDALLTLGTHPMRYLIMPRLIAALCALPCLVLLADIIGILGGLLVSTVQLKFLPTPYLRQTYEALHGIDLISGLIKAAVFGAVAVLCCCYHGYYARGGAKGVGIATTRAVVSASVCILCANYLLTNLFFDT